MALYTTLASLSQTAASNAADGSTDAPSTIDQQTNLLASYAAQLRDGNGFTTGVGNLGQCRLTKSGANLLLSRFNGIGLTINGVACAIPSAGLTLAATALTPGTLYYIYAVATGTAVSSIEPSTTGHSTDTASGMEIKTGDATRSLVGMARVITGPAWQDAADQRFVVSWFNRQPLALRAASAVLAAAPGSTPTELDVRYRSQWLHWAGQQTLFGVTASAYNNTLSQTIVTTLSLDGTTTLAQQTLSEPLANGVVNASITATIVNPPSEGYHYVTFLASAAGGTASWTADCFTWGQVQG